MAFGYRHGIGGTGQFLLSFLLQSQLKEMATCAVIGCPLWDKGEGKPSGKGDRE